MGSVEVVHCPMNASPLRAQVVFVEGMTVAGVLQQSGFLERHPELVGLPAGIFSQTVSLDTLVKPGDRVELYRPLLVNPMEKRRQRAKRA